MSETKYNELKSKYLIAVARCKELENLLETKNRMWSDYEENHDIADGHIRSLCEMILVKDSTKLKLGKSKSFDDYSTVELIEEAKESFVNYCKDRTKLLNDILNTAEKRAREVESLKDQIATMLVSGNVSGATTVEEIIESAEKETKKKEAISKTPASIKEAFNAGNIELIYEDDMTEEETKLLKSSIEVAEQAALTPTSIPISPCVSKIEKIKKSKEDVATAHMIDLSQFTSSFKENEWTIINVIGSTGLSRYKDIEEYIIETYPSLTKANIRVVVMSLNKSGVLKRETIKLPISRKSIIYELTELGKRLYKKEFNKNPVASEYSKVIAEHDNGEHGYGIIEFGEYLESTGQYEKVSTYNRSSSIKIVINGETHTYIPDIVCVSPKGYSEYIEYERGFHNQVNFNMKCEKMCRASRQLSFVTTNKDTCKEIQKQVETWISTKKPHELKPYRLRIGTVLSIKDENAWNVEYNFASSIEPIKNNL